MGSSFENVRSTVNEFSFVFLLAIFSGPTTAFRIDSIEWKDFALFNETCYSSNGKQCAAGPPFNLICSSPSLTTKSLSGRCGCAPGHVFLSESETCWLIPNTAHDLCAHDIQCQAGMWGAHSRCNQRTSKCECFADQLKYGRKLAYWKAEAGGRCHLRNPIDLCRTTENCIKKIGTNSYCKLDAGSMHGSCQCQEGTHIWYPRGHGGNCLPVVIQQGDKCQVDEQCTVSSLGTLSRCVATYFGSRCECYVPETGLRTAYYPKTRQCFVQRKLGDQCNSRTECKASLGEAVECDEKFTGENIQNGDPFMKTCRRIELGDWCNTEEDCSVSRDDNGRMTCDKTQVIVGVADEETTYEGRCAVVLYSVGAATDFGEMKPFRLLVALLSVSFFLRPWIIAP